MASDTNSRSGQVLCFIGAKPTAPATIPIANDLKEAGLASRLACSWKRAVNATLQSTVEVFDWCSRWSLAPADSLSSFIRSPTAADPICAPNSTWRSHIRLPSPWAGTPSRKTSLHVDQEGL